MFVTDSLRIYVCNSFYVEVCFYIFSVEVYLLEILYEGIFVRFSVEVCLLKIHCGDMFVSLSVEVCLLRILCRSTFVTDSLWKYVCYRFSVKASL